MTPVLRRWTTITTLCIALLLVVPAVAADGTGTADAGTTLRASTAGVGSAVVQAAIDAPAIADQPAWIGLLVLAFGGLLAGLWLGAVALAALQGLAETERAVPGVVTPSPSRGRRDEAPPADGP